MYEVLSSLLLLSLSFRELRGCPFVGFVNRWETVAKFPTTTPLPVLRIKVMADNSKSLLDADGKVVAKVCY